MLPVFNFPSAIDSMIFLRWKLYRNCLPLQVWRCAKECIRSSANVVDLWKTLQNECLVAKIGFATTENGPRQVCVWLGLASPDVGSFLSLTAVLLGARASNASESKVNTFYERDSQFSHLPTSSYDVQNSTIRSSRNFRKLVLTSGSAIWEVQKAIARSWPLFADATPQNESPDAEEGKE